MNNQGEKPEYKTEGELNLLDYIAVIVKHRRMIFRLCTTAVIVAAIVSLLLPKIYSATARIMPSQTGTGAMPSLTTKLGGLTALAGGMLEVPDQAQVYVEMLKSRTMADTIINSFNLLEAYDEELMKDAREKLGDNTNFVVSDADTISITVEDNDPQRAADMANAYVEELDKLNQKLNISDASRQRTFLEKRIEETKNQLAQAETYLKQFQERHKIVALDEQATASIRGAAHIKSQIIATETELEVLKSFITGKNNQTIRLEQKLGELNAQLAKIEDGEEADNPGHSGNPKGSSNFYIPFSQVPNLGLQLGRLMRAVKVQETVFELLTQQYELARIAEAKDTPTIQILDKAVAPEEESKPNRLLIVALSGMAAFWGAIFLAFICEYLDGMDAGDKQRWQDMKAAVRGSIPFMGK